MESVLVVPRRALFPDCDPQGFAPFADSPRARDARVAEADRVRQADTRALEAFERAIDAHGFFVERARAEREPDWKQVIPYVVVVREGEVLLLRRSKRGGDARLHEKLSIGVGGHVEPVDAREREPRSTAVARCARREIEEEIEIGGPYHLRCVGWINDDSNSVGAVHVGLVHVLATSAPVSIRERDVLHGELVAPRELAARRERGEDFETWSALLIERLNELLPAAELMAATPAAAEST
jgi:predicted NUDIX family phosphoesterase